MDNGVLFNLQKEENSDTHYTVAISLEDITHKKTKTVGLYLYKHFWSVRNDEIDNGLLVAGEKMMERHEERWRLSAQQCDCM